MDQARQQEGTAVLPRSTTAGPPSADLVALGLVVRRIRQRRRPLVRRL
ncbi:hypothetical protein EV189_3379 [Motilibacter rhizosphaerae]|uniref:Uncharacterized protein n=1 Tax=Motilibacter rhizosphaerae TaxID=598652 RepID=A0A4Q7NGE6_9ACTN|nr:hypothetical protein [Motilibacter rhizosphaerae]RZS82981.1 hypothetical protein EV189_3379 [Motilibacter rhizosphaerae]